ncbi:maintenance of mitochondrial morphology protein 1 [Polyporus arcularius HHB13444]|uniref:Maintenance of mitochondrial morphology protein 1 n=2 Tax=Polyporaceae TaxID=5317 RepID=A0A5C3PX94_9APHY|nr:maintenance of mitochondrial morphology protein 1 [Polyporus brumalis]TFK94306.1 maintenance of mitochondrial morphology protein 1 [Polyporus arcularius HHB13444]
MASAYVFTLQPTFTQGLILGQASILFLLFLVLKYLFFDTDPDRPYRKASYPPKVELGSSEEDLNAARVDLSSLNSRREGEESSEWLNVFLQQVLEAYRVKLRNGLTGADGDEIARQRVEEFANKMRPAGLLDYIKVHSVDMGSSAPKLSRARVRRELSKGSDPEIDYDMTYMDSISISVSTSVLFNYPFPSFARLPVSLTISLSLFASSVRLTPPQPNAPHPTITFTLPAPHSDFTLNIKTTSLMGSRAKLEDVPKVHELIQHQIRRVIMEKGTWKVVLPGLASVSEVKEDVKAERKLAEEAFS